MLELATIESFVEKQKIRTFFYVLYYDINLHFSSLYLSLSLFLFIARKMTKI